MRFAFPVAVAALIALSLPAVGVLTADAAGYGPDLNTWLETRGGLSHHLAVSLPAAFVLLAVPLGLVVLHLLRLRRTPVVVSSTLFWRASTEDLSANALLRWLQRTVPLLLQLLAAFLFAYGVLGPRLHAALGSGKHFIILIDNSASMAATDAGPSRLDWAKAEALKRIDAAAEGDVGMVVAFNRAAEIRQSYTADRELLRAAVRGVRQSVGQTRLDEALRLAAGLANPTSSTENEAARPPNADPGKERTYVPAEGVAAEVHLYTDGGFPPVADFSLANLALEYHAPPVAEKSNNVAVVRLEAASGEAGQLSVTAAVRNYRDTTVEVSVQLDAVDGSRAVRSYTKPVRLNAAETAEVEFTVPDPELPLRVTLEGAADSLALDDAAWVVPAVARKARVAVYGPKNPVLDAFLGSAETRKVADVTRLGTADLADPAKYLDPARNGRFDLVVFDRCAPTDLPRANTLFIGSRPPGIGVGATVKNPRIVGWAGGHPVTRGLRDLYAVPIAGAARLTNLPPGTERILESDGNVVLLAGVPRPPFTDLVLAFPILDDAGKWNTLWPLEPSFVLFLRNVLRAYGNVREGITTDVTRAGDSVPLRCAPGRRVTVAAPGGRTVSLEPTDRGEATFTDTADLGLYTATDGSETHRFAVNLLAAEESDLSPHPTVIVGSQTATAGEVRRPPRELWKWAVLAALLVLMAEWWVYASRVR
ncbi:VWA domain-containing protein [Gemmata sp.]|uniref:VWA domain-containing protein n=1 Tax=Gemmata sp. TaxID=1914242 RepID=UPI003F71C9C4